MEDIEDSTLDRTALPTSKGLNESRPHRLCRPRRLIFLVLPAYTLDSQRIISLSPHREVL